MGKLYDFLNTLVSKVNASVKTVNGVAPDEAGNVDVEGSGGNSAQPDWNANEGEAGHILNRTHYDEREELLAETTLSVTDEGAAYLPGRLNLIAGHAYIVCWNGVDYHCTAVAQLEDGNILVYLGNMGGLNPDVEATGEPFVIWDDNIDEGAIVAPLDGSENPTVSVRHNFVRKLDNKYLDLEWLPAKSGRVILEEETVVDGGLSAVSTDNFTVGAELIVYINGVLHESALIYDTLDGWGANVEVAVSAEVFGLVIFMFDDSRTIVFNDMMNGQRVKICMKEIEKIPEKYLPDNIGSSVQSDWNQTDETAADFIRNKPFGEMYGDTLTWDGNTEGLLDWNDGNYKISDTIVTYDEVGDEALFYIKGYYDPATTLHKGDELFFPVMDGLFTCGVFMFVSESALGVDLGDGIAFSEPGIYCSTLGETEYGVTFPGYTGFPVTKKMEEKYLPGAVILYVDTEMYLYATADTSDTSKRVTRAELMEVVQSGRTVYVNISGSGSTIYLTVGYFGFEGSYGGAVCPDTGMSFFTAEYVPNTTT